MPQVLGTEATRENLYELLSLCAANQPGDHVPDSHAWGFTAASNLLHEAKGSDLYAAAQQVFGEFLKHDTEERARLATSLADPAVLPADAWSVALRRADLSESVKADLRFGLGMAVAAGQVPYDVKLRIVVGRPGWESFRVAFALHDHAWFLEHAVEVLGTGREALANVMPLLRALDQAEATELQRELLAHHALWQDDTAEVLAHQIEDMLAADRFAKRDGALRWQRS
jgi:hypothetical protein